jgi:hypothetical protein
MSEALIAIVAAALFVTALSSEPRVPSKMTEGRIAQAAPPVERRAPPAADDRNNNDDDRRGAGANDRDDD